VYGTDRKKETLAKHGDALVLLVQVDSAAKKVVSLVSSFGRIGSVAVPTLCLWCVVAGTVTPTSSLQDMATAGEVILTHIFKLLLRTFFYYTQLEYCY
jgi:hypothetical protein